MIDFFYVSFFVSVSFFALFLFNSLSSVIKKNNIKKAYRSLCIGTVSSALVFFLPFYYNFFTTTEQQVSVIKTILLAAHHAIRLFVVDVNYEEIQAFAHNFGAIGTAYSFFGIILFLIAPILTFSFVLSFAQDFTLIYYKYLCINKHFCIFTEFNPNTYALATDIRKRFPRANIIFIEVNREYKDEISTVKYMLKDIHAHLLPNDVQQIFKIINMPKRNTDFFVLNEDEGECFNWLIALSSSEIKNGTRKIYVKLENENKLISNITLPKNTEIHKVEHFYTLCMRTLENLGTRLFDTAIPNEKGEKTISALIVGLGRYGTEMVKNLSWFTQVEGYTTEIHAFDKDPRADKRFEHLCPGFFFNNTTNNHCNIYINPNTYIESSDFDNEVLKLKNTNYIFIALGDDNLNITVAYQLRAIFAKLDLYPIIQTVLRDSNAGELLTKSQNYRGEAYNIEFVGSYTELYSYDYITDSKNKKAVLESFSKWSSDEAAKALMQQEEQYKLGKANVLYKNLLKQLNITADEDSEEIDTYSRSFHRQWVNFKLSEGYQYGPKRNDIAKTHPTIVPYENLSEMEKKRII